MNIFNQLKNKILGMKNNKIASDPVSKVIGKKLKMIKYGAIAGIASFLVPVIIIIAVVAYFVGFVQTNTDRIENLLRGGCFFCSNEELEQMKEDQFYTKIRIVKEVAGSRVDDVVLASTILYVGQYNDIINELYEEDFDEDNFFDEVQTFIESLGVTGSESYNGISQEEIDLVDAATIVMIYSNVDGKYDEENYKKALASPGFGSDNWIVNGSTCVIKSLYDFANGVLHELPFFGALAGDGNFIDKSKTFWNTIDICKEGFIGGTVDEVKKITDPDTKQRKKEQIAQDIIDFANFYKSLFLEEDPCLYSGSVGTGDIINWRQCDPRWANISIGSSTVCRIGCTTTAISYIIAKSATQLAVSEINPGVYASEKSGYLGSLINWTFSKIAPKMHVLGEKKDINKSNYVEKISSIINTPIDGKQAFVLVEASDGGGTHWVAVDHVENGTVYVLDPSASQEGLTDITTMHRWSTGGPSSYRVLYADDVPFGGTGSSSSSTTTSIDVTSSAYQERLEKSKKYYQASDEMKDVIIAGDSKMGSAGCIISSLMGMYYLYTGNEIDVGRFIEDIVKEGEWQINGAGHSSPYFDSDENSPLLTQNWGLSGHPISTDLNTIKETLRKGKKIMVNIGPNSGPYPTSYGHFLVLDHINPDTGKIYVWDPVGSTSRNGYKTDSEIQKGILNVIKNGAWEFSSTMVNGSDMCETTTGVGEITIPSEYGNGGYTVTVYDDFNWVYNQGKVYDKWAAAGSVYDNGIATYEGRYLIACTETFGTVGDKVDFFLEDGTKIPAIIADIKSSGDAGYNKWGHNNGQNVLEFEVSHLAFYSTYKSNPGTNGWFEEEWGGKRVASATNLGENIIN